MKDDVTYKILRFIIMIIGALVGFIVSNIIIQYVNFHKVVEAGIAFIVTIIFAIIFFLFAPFIIHRGNKVLLYFEKYLSRFSLSDLIFGTVGLIIGLVLAFLITQPLYSFQLPFIGNTISVIVAIAIYLLLGILCIKLAVHYRKEVLNGIYKLRAGSKERTIKNQNKSKEIKILDTSVIIDGRIKEIMEAGFIEGQLYVPIFVLEEIQYIADSDNDLRRQKGRRGLDILKLLQNNYPNRVEVIDKRYADTEKVDSKILKMAIDFHAKVITNDYNLNKVAAVQDIEVLNINALANAMKPVFIPGEEISVVVLKAGKEQNQGIGYLDDGTMIVVENGKKYIGKTITAVVTSVLQTAAGKMIFVKKENS